MVTEVQCKQADMDTRGNDGIYSDLGVMDYEEDRVRPKRYTTLRSRFLYFKAFLLFNLTFASTFAGGGIRHHELVVELFTY